MVVWWWYGGSGDSFGCYKNVEVVMKRCIVDISIIDINIFIIMMTNQKNTIQIF